MIVSIDPHIGLKVKLENDLIGIVYLVNISSDFKEEPTSGFHVDQVVTCRVLSVSENKFIFFFFPGFSRNKGK